MAWSRLSPRRVVPAVMRRGLAAALMLGLGHPYAVAQGVVERYSWSSDSWGEAPRPYGGTRGVYFNEAEAILSPRMVVYGLHDRGFTEIGRPRFDGAAYRVEATGPRGLRVRLVVDARDGAVIGRERLTGPDFAPDRFRPPVPGYGWTEEDAAPRRFREAERIVPPADIPSAPPLRSGPFDDGRNRAERGPAPPRFDAGPRPETAQRPDANPLGMNPDAAGRGEAPRRTAKVVPPPKPAAPRVAPLAPAPSLRPSEPAAPQEVTPAAKSPESDKPAEAKEAIKPARTAEPAPAPAERPSDKTWKDPPADGSRKNVRVIGGATVVPGGAGEAAPSGAN